MARAQGVQVRLLGSFDLVADGVRIERAAFERPSGLRLLKLLLATPGHRVRREAAAEALWPEMDPERSSANLRKAIHFARRALTGATPGMAGGVADGDGGPLVGDGEALTFAPAGPLDVDADTLAAAVAGIEAGERAADHVDALIRLGGLELLPEDPYEEWLVPIRERLARRTMAALSRAAAGARESGDRATAIRLVEALLAREPADEAAHRLAIELHLEAGELHAARRQLQRARAAIAEAYGVEPDPALERLVATAAAERATRRFSGPAEAPIVGRVRELEATEPAFDEVAGGEAAAVLLRGPAGIGKSRLLRELTGLARASGWSSLELRGLEGSGGEPFAAMASAIVSLLGEQLAAFPEPGRSAVLAASPVAGLHASVAFGSDAGVTQAFVEALRELGGQPLAILVDDAQWLDERSLGVLAATLRARVPLLLAIAVRDDPALLVGGVAALLDDLARLGGREIRIGPLGPREVQAIVEREVDGDRIDDDLADRIAGLAAGVPLFALEVFRSAREAGLVESREGRWSRRRGAEELPVPSGVSRLVERRVASLGPEARRILATAAELGDVVAFEDLVATDVPSDAVLDAVDLALGQGIVVEAGGRYAFAHPLYRAALRTGLRPRDRADVHRRIAVTLAGGTPSTDAAAVRRAGAAGLDLSAVAHHAASAVELGQSELAPLAVGFGVGAGERQAYLFDHGTAIATLRRAIRIWQRLAHEDQPRYPICHAQVELGQALRRTGDDGGAMAAFREGIRLARDDDELGSAYSAAAWLPYEHGRFAAALELLDEGRARIEAPIPRAILDSSRGWILGRNGAWLEAEPILAAAAEALEPTSPSAVLMRALDRLSIAIAERDPAASLAVLDRATAMARELGRTGELATYEMHRGGTLRDLGRLDDAVAALERAKALARQSGEQYIEAVTEWVWAEVDQTSGNPAGAIGHRRRELAIFGEIGGNVRHEALAHAHIAHLARQLGDADVDAFEAGVARAMARHSGIPELADRVEWSLATEDWFAPQPVWAAASADPAGSPAVGNGAGTATRQPAGHG